MKHQKRNKKNMSVFAKTAKRYFGRLKGESKKRSAKISGDIWLRGTL